jgi:transcriptional regulator with XRE-family HTH domain
VGESAAAQLLIEARERSGLSQRALAHRARTAQSVIARIEKGTVSPSWKTLERLLHHTGFELKASLVPKLQGSSHMLKDVPRILSLTPEQRLLELGNAARLSGVARKTAASAFDPEKILRTLSRRQVRYVLVGATAARLQGFPRLTADADITPARDSANLERLAAALRDLGARMYTEWLPEGLPFQCDGKSLAPANVWNLVTDAGRLDVIFEPSGTRGYDDLAAAAITYEALGLEVPAASLEDILRSKRAFGRPQDQNDVIILREMLKRR